MDPSFEPCTCDLNPTECDLNCCCDRANCDQSDFDAFGCESLQRTRKVFDRTINEWYCRDTYDRATLNKPDWFPLLCIWVSYNS
jgi:hypothetical protein